eukprot:SAG11_NODE_1608_length_4588_cov_7.455558_2_plen_79_part_00
MVASGDVAMEMTTGENLFRSLHTGVKEVGLPNAGHETEDVILVRIFIANLCTTCLVSHGTARRAEWGARTPRAWPLPA